MKKITLSLLLFILFIGLAATRSYAESDFIYTLNDNGEATIIAYHGNATDLTIPNVIEGHNVIAIDKHAFDENYKSTNGDTMVSLTISEGIKSIGDFAFLRCDNIESVHLPESLLQLGMSAFLECPKLKTVNIPNNLTLIGHGAFEQTAIEEVTIPKNIQAFDGNEFRLCTNLKKVIIYNDTINYYNGEYDTRPFEYHSDDLVLYGNEGSTTQEYALANGIQFKTIASLGAGEETPEPTPVPTAKPTPTLVPAATSTPSPTVTAKPTPTATATSTPVPTVTPTPKPTATTAPTPTKTPEATPTNTTDETIVLPYAGNGGFFMIIIPIVLVTSIVLFKKMKQDE